MGSTEVNQPPATDEARLVLDDACARNAVVELHRQNNHQNIPAARGRMLMIKDDLLFVAEPQVIGRDSRLIKGMTVEAYFNSGGVIYCFRSTIQSLHAIIRLNERKKIIGYALAAPTDVRPGQRRSYFRTSLVSDNPINGRLRLVTSVDPIQCSICEPPLTGTLVDGSPTGFGINLPNTPPSRIKLYDTFFLMFAVSDTPHTLNLLVETRQIREIPNIGATRLGLLTMPWPNQREHTLAIQPLLQLLSAVQRRQRRAA